MAQRALNKLIHGRSGPYLWVVAAVLAVVLWACYCNSFDAAWQYDDDGNILSNEKIHITQWSWSQFKMALSAGHSFQTISRPLAYLSFAVNHRLGGLDPFGYHLVNFFIHWGAALFLFLFVRDTLQLPVFKGRYHRQAWWIGMIAALLWATHPIQVTAVTYIVQRMASMAGLFYIAALYLYLKARTGRHRSQRIGRLVLAGVSALLALLTKENTILIFYGVILYELLLIQGVNKQSFRRAILWAGGLSVVIVLIGALYMDVQALFKPYDIRPFNQLERVLTQPRVLLFYLSLILFPTTSRLTLLHDIEVSHSLLSPWTTAASILVISGAVVALLLSARRYPMLSFCGLFFFLNHGVEASFLNLELVYEHRNYLPSMLLFVLPAIVAVRAIQFFKYQRFIPWLIGGVVCLSLISQSNTTYLYNAIFKTELSLWVHAVEVSPRLALAHSNLGDIYWAMGYRDRALEQFKKAKALGRFNNFLQKGYLYYNLGLYEAYESKDFSRASGYFEEAIEIHNGHPKIWYELIRTKIVMGQFEEASLLLGAPMSEWPQKVEFHYLHALIFAKNGRCQDALAASKKALAIDKKDGRALMVAAGSLNCLGEREMAIDYWKQFIALEPKSLIGLLALVDLFVQSGRIGEARLYFDRLAPLTEEGSADEILRRFEGEVVPYPPDRRGIERAFQALMSRS